MPLTRSMATCFCLLLLGPQTFKDPVDCPMCILLPPVSSQGACPRWESNPHVTASSRLRLFLWATRAKWAELGSSLLQNPDSQGVACRARPQRLRAPSLTTLRGQGSNLHYLVQSQAAYQLADLGLITFGPREPLAALATPSVKFGVVSGVLLTLYRAPWTTPHGTSVTSFVFNFLRWNDAPLKIHAALPGWSGLRRLQQ